MIRICLIFPCKQLCKQLWDLPLTEPVLQWHVRSLKISKMLFSSAQRASLNRLRLTQKRSLQRESSSALLTGSRRCYLQYLREKSELENRTSDLPHMTLFNSGNKNEPKVLINSCDSNDFHNKGNHKNAEWTTWCCFWRDELFHRGRSVGKRNGVDWSTSVCAVFWSDLCESVLWVNHQLHANDHIY